MSRIILTKMKSLEHFGQMKKASWVKSLYTVAITIALCILLAGCGTPRVPFYSGSPLLYGLEGSDASCLVVQKNGLYGYADSTGKIIIKPQYEDARPFCEGVAAVENHNGMYGYIDATGRQVIPFKFYGAMDFHNGKALVSDRLQELGELFYEPISVIDQKGNTVRQTDYTAAYNCADGITPVKKFNNGTYTNDLYLLDKDYNELKVPVLNERILGNGYFSEELGALLPASNSLYSFYKKSGEKAFDTEFYIARPFSEGLAPVMPLKDGHWGYIDKNGKTAIAPAFLFAGKFGDGCALVEMGDKSWKIINSSGQELSEMQFPIDTATSFTEGLCAVGKLKVKPVYYNDNSDYKWGFADGSGRLVIDFQFDEVTPFKNGIAEVLVDGKIGYIDETGKYIWEPK